VTLAQPDDIGAEMDALGRRAAGNLLILPLVVFFGLAFFALCYVGYVLWPRMLEVPVSADAPTLPIEIGGAVFNVPPAAIRLPPQRRSGTQERVDLVYVWPTLTPPIAATKYLGERLFVTISVASTAMPPSERLKFIYPRYIEPGAAAAPEGLTRFAFRQGTPYQGEDLFYDATAPGRFLARCTRRVNVTPGVCLFERRDGDVDILVRVPRDWLDQWRAVADALDRLSEQWRPTGQPNQ
jgi:hypothetical protein